MSHMIEPKTLFKLVLVALRLFICIHILIFFFIECGGDFDIVLEQNHTRSNVRYLCGLAFTIFSLLSPSYAYCIHFTLLDFCLFLSPPETTNP